MPKQSIMRVPAGWPVRQLTSMPVGVMAMVEVGLGGGVDVGVGGLGDMGWHAGSFEPGGRTQIAPLMVAVCAAGFVVAAPKSSPSGVGPFGWRGT